MGICSSLNFLTLVIKDILSLFYLLSGNKVPIILVGNKTDLEDERQVTKQMVDEALKDQSRICKYIETSAKHNVNVAQLFIELLEHAKELEQPPPPPQQSRRLSRRLSSLGNINLTTRRKSSLPKVKETTMVDGISTKGGGGDSRCIIA